MDAFFASVEQRDDPRLRGKPVIVGGDSRRGVVAAASYEVREYGVRSAMSMVEAKQRCPHAIVVPGRMRRYAEVSGEVFGIFRRFTPEVEGLSVDEAFLDVTGSLRLFGDGESIASRIKAAIREELDLVASAGVAPSKFVAKVASDLDKPDGLVVVRPGEVEGFLAPLPIRRMWGVGPKAAAKLGAYGFETLGDLAQATQLEAILGSWGAQVQKLARGEDEREVVTLREAKSMGAEHTFERDLKTAAALEPHLLHQAARVAERLTGAGLRGRRVTVKVKYGDHVLKTRQVVLPRAVCDTDSIYEAARGMLGRFPPLSKGVRLTGISVGQIEDDAEPELFPDEERLRREKLESVTHELRQRFGDKGLVRGTLVQKPDRD